MVGPLDEYPIHQAPLPVTWAGTSDRNFYDRCYFNAHDRTGDIFVITGLGYYPNLGTKDAFFLVRRGDTQTAVHLSDAIDDDRLNQHVGGYRIEVLEPLQQAARRPRGDRGHRRRPDLGGLLRRRSRSSRTSCAPAAGSPSTPSGSPRSAPGAGTIVDRRRGDRRRPRTAGSAPATARGASAPWARRSPPGAPADPPFEGMWWLYVPMRFDEFAVVLIIQEDPDGFRTLNDCTRVWKDGRVEQLGWPRVDDPLRLGHPDPDRRDHHAARRPTGKPVRARGRVAARRCRSTSVAGTAATPTGPTACGRARASPSGSPTT